MMSASPASRALVAHCSAQAGSLPSEIRLRPYFLNSASEVSVSGPYDRWPTGSGFDKFHGFIGGETNQWAPAIYDGTVRVEHKPSPDYHFTVDMTDQAVNWVSAQQALTPQKPFYLYFATGAT